MKTVLLSDVCEFKRGLTYKKTDEVDFSSNIVLRANNIDLKTFELKLTGLKYIKDDIQIPASKKLQKDSLLICTASGSKSHLGKVAYIDRDYNYAFGGFMGLLIPNKSLIYPRYLYILLTSQSFRKHLSDLTDGANINNLKFSLIEKFQFYLPKPEEQKRIVKKLDEVFVKIGKAEENIEKNLKNTQALFVAKLEEIFGGQGNIQPIKEFAEVKGGKRVPKGEKLLTDKTDYPYIRVTDFNDQGSVDLDDIHYVSEKVYEKIARYTISTEDLYISIAGTIGKTGIIPTELNGANLTENACKIVLNENVGNKYLYYFTKTKSFLEQAGLSTRTTAMPKMALSRVKEIEVPIADISDQFSLVTEFDKLSNQMQKLQKLYQQKLDNLEELKQSLLKQAFSGKL